jgi:hypothetical protein
MEGEATTYEGDAHKTGESAPTPVNGDIARVGEGRKDPVDIYYELHGSGPHKVVFIMGTLPPSSLSSQQRTGKRCAHPPPAYLLLVGFATSCKAWHVSVRPPPQGNCGFPTDSARHTRLYVESADG